MKTKATKMTTKAMVTKISRCVESQLIETEAPQRSDQMLQNGDQVLQISSLTPQKELAGQD